MRAELKLKSTTIGNLSCGDENSYIPEESECDRHDKEGDDTTIAVVGAMEKETTPEVADEAIKVAIREMEKDSVEFHISSDNLVVYERAGVESSMEAAKYESKDEGYIEKVPKFLSMSISRGKGMKDENEDDREKQI
jgi:hypothetical protein